VLRRQRKIDVTNCRCLEPTAKLKINVKLM
jgi:hypothetical protein